MDKVSMSYLFSFSRYQTKCEVLIYIVDDVINFKIYLRSNPKAMTDGENEG